MYLSRAHIIWLYSSSSLHAAMQSTAHIVFSISSGVASINESVLDPYGVRRYEERADNNPPSSLGPACAGLLAAIGIGDVPPRKSSICSIRDGRREYKNKVCSISNTYNNVNLRSSRFTLLTGGQLSRRWLLFPFRTLNRTTVASCDLKLFPNRTDNADTVIVWPSTSTIGKLDCLGKLSSSARPVEYASDMTMKSNTSGNRKWLAKVAQSRNPVMTFSTM